MTELDTTGSTLDATIDTYDRTAVQYANRWTEVSLGPILGEFESRLPPNALVLDVGCGMARDAVALNSLGHRAFGVDLSIGMCRVAAEKGTGVAQADMRMLPFPLHTFDGVWSSASLLHLDDQAFVVAVGELRDIAKPGGLLYIGVKERVEGIPETQWIDIDKNEPRWYRYWTEAELREVFTDAGLTVEHLSRNEQIAGAGAPFINWYLRTPNDQ